MHDANLWKQVSGKSLARDCQEYFNIIAATLSQIATRN